DLPHLAVSRPCRAVHALLERSGLRNQIESEAPEGSGTSHCYALRLAGWTFACLPALPALASGFGCHFDLMSANTASGVASTSGSLGHGMKSFMVAPLVIVIASRAMAASIRSVRLNGPFLSMYESQPMNSLYDICARSSPTVRPSASARSCSNSSVGVRLFFRR